MGCDERDQHVVSRGLLRHFAEPVVKPGGKVWHRTHLILKRSPTARAVSIRDVFTRRDFNTAWIDGERITHLEKEWAQVESAALPAIRHALAGQRSGDITPALKATVALHLARSRSARIVVDRIWSGMRGTEPEVIAADPEFRHRAAALPSAPWTEEELLRLVAERMDEVTSTHLLRVQRMGEMFNDLCTRFDPFHPQFVEVLAPRLGLVLGDVPVVVSRWSGMHVGVHHGLAIMDGEFLFMPLSPKLGLSLTTSRQSDAEIGPTMVWRLNNLIWRNSIDAVVAHPKFAWEQSLALESHPTIYQPLLAGFVDTVVSKPFWRATTS